MSICATVRCSMRLSACRTLSALSLPYHSANLPRKRRATSRSRAAWPRAPAPPLRLLQRVARQSDRPSRCARPRRTASPAPPPPRASSRPRRRWPRRCPARTGWASGSRPSRRGRRGCSVRRRHVGAEVRHGHHVRRVLHQHADVAVVGVVVVGAVAHHDVGLPLADEPRDRPAVLQRGQQFAVVDVQHLGGDAEDVVPPVRPPPCGGAPAGRRPSASGRCRRW